MTLLYNLNLFYRKNYRIELSTALTLINLKIYDLTKRCKHGKTIKEIQ